MAYCTVTQVKLWLPGTYSTTDLPDADITNTHILAADKVIDATLGRLYYPFNGTTGTPATPGIINMISRHIAASYAMRQINIRGQSSILAAKIDVHESRANDLLTVVANDFSQLPHETKTGVTLSFGTGSGQSWGLDSNEALLCATSPMENGYQPNVLAVRINSGTTGLTEPTLVRHGYDFSYRYDDNRQRVIFTALNGTIYAAGVTLKVDYDWDYRRRHSESQRIVDGMVLA